MRAASPKRGAKRLEPVMAQELADWLVRAAFRVVAGLLFRKKVLGRENIPPRGPALLVANHLTFLDAFLIGSCLQPVVRFLVWKPYYDRRLLTWGFRLARAIPVWTHPYSAFQAIARSRAELKRGHILGIFAEGSISRTGEILPFKRGLEEIMRGTDAPIIPVHLGGLWESIFSFQGGRFRWKRLRSLRHPVVISFGAPMPAAAKAGEVREAIEQLTHQTRVTSGPSALW
ncbi:MAG: 1-acyl-sn-glycerol-3-phosphate acyltransferase [Bryobacteraceae bacterium]